MRRVFKISILTVFIALIAFATASCKKKTVNKIAVNNQFAISLFNDTISIKEILNDMDSTTNSWLRVRNDSIFAYYADSVNGVIKASDLLDNIENTDFTTSTGFSLPPIVSPVAKDTTLYSDRFTTIPFDFEGFDIEQVIIRKGMFSFDVNIIPEIPMLEKIEIFSNQLVSQNDEPLRIVIEYGKGRKIVNLSEYKILPDSTQSVAFSSYITFHYDPSMGVVGGDYVCELNGGITDLGFKTVYAVVNKSLDSIYDRDAEIDFGINGLSGSAFLPVPTINLTYRNTFGLHANCDINKLQFINTSTGLVTDLLAYDHVDVDINPTNGAYRHFRVEGFTDEIDALAGYNHLDFSGEVNLAMPGEHISISDTSSVDVIADVEMPFSFRISDLRYTDTIEVNFGEDTNIQNYLDEIDFFIDYNNKIPLQINLQGLFLKDDQVIDSLFDSGGTILYNEPSSLECVITDSKLDNVMRANKMIMRFGVTTDFSSSGSQNVVIKESDNIAVRMRMLTKTYEINIDEL